MTFVVIGHFVEGSCAPIRPPVCFGVKWANQVNTQASGLGTCIANARHRDTDREARPWALLLAAKSPLPLRQEEQVSRPVPS